MSNMSNLDLEIQDKIADTRLVRVDSFPNGRAYRWLVVLEVEKGTWSVGIIEKKPDTRTEKHPFQSWVYFESIVGDMSAPWWDHGAYAEDRPAHDLQLVNNNCIGNMVPDDFDSFDPARRRGNHPVVRLVLEEMYYKIAVNAAI